MLRGIPIDTGTWDHVIYKFAANNSSMVNPYLNDAIHMTIDDTLAAINNNNIMGSRSSKEELTWKSTIPFSCPNCGALDNYVVYLNIETLICNHCNHESDVRLYCKDVELIAIDPLTEEPLER